MSTNLPVGEVRPSQLMFNYGIGAIVDLPKISVVVMGLDEWPVNPSFTRTIIEDRLLSAVQYHWPTVQQMLAPPVVPDQGYRPDPRDPTSRIGVPVATFPRWMVCPWCHTLAPLSDELFKLHENPVVLERNYYYHINCSKANKPEVVPARFLAACENGHLDDFPWIEYVHQFQDGPCTRPRLILMEFGPSGEASELVVRCESCEAARRLSDAFDPNQRENLPLCRGRRPHLRDYEDDGCQLHMRPIILGASNTWFPAVITSLAIPAKSNRLGQLVDEQWDILADVLEPSDLRFLRRRGGLGMLDEYTDAQIWDAIEARRTSPTNAEPLQSLPDLKGPEWRVFSQCDTSLNSKDFKLRLVDPPRRYSDLIDQVVLVEKLREVRAMIGFTRIDAVGELTDPDHGLEIDPAPLSRQDPKWVPANEVRGEGIFIRFNERKLQQWLDKQSVKHRMEQFFEAHQKWRHSRGLEPEENFPGMRYVLVHSFAHALMRQLALECGYSPASIRERIYAREPGDEGGPMAGFLVYTAAPDSEGTLGGLVSLGEPETLERHITQALDAAHLCANDPLCAEHTPSQRGLTLHAVACHSCTFTPETSCERGNKYLDRATLVATIQQDDLAYFQT